MHPSTAISMKTKRLLVLNRGKIAILFLRVASEVNLTVIAIYTYEGR